MFEISVHTQGGTRVGDLMCNKEQCFVGKDADCFVVLQGWKVAAKHALLEKKDDGVYITHLEEKNGLETRVNGKPITEHGPLQESDEIGIHSYSIKVKFIGTPKVIKPVAEAQSVTSGVPQKAENNSSDSQALSFLSKVTNIAKAGSTAVASSFSEIKNKAQGKQTELNPESADEGRVEKSETTKQKVKKADEVKVSKVEKVLTAEQQTLLLAREWQGKVHDALLQQMDLRRVNVHDMSDDKLETLTKKLLNEVVNDLAGFPRKLDKQEIVKRVLSEAIGLGPLEELLAQEDISEIMVNAADEIFYEKQGKISRSDIVFSDDRAVIFAIERIVAPLGRRIDESSPMVDARLKDGSRVNAVIPPLSLKGPCITIRKFMKEKLTGEHLVGFGSATPIMMEFLENAVKYKQNIVVSGGTGSGKTTLLNILSNYIPEHERIVTVEDSAELKLYQDNLVSLEARPPNQEGKGAVEIRDLLKNCLRMRPDRIVIGECRGGEALDMLQAMNTGHDGSLTTAHANSPRDCISRIEVMVLMAGMDLPSIAIREQIASAVHIIVQQTRFSCGTRKITSIAEVTGIDGGRVQLGEIFKYQQTGYDADGKVQGEFVATGLVPRCYGDLTARGISVDVSVFDKGVAA